MSESANPHRDSLLNNKFLVEAVMDLLEQGVKIPEAIAAQLAARYNLAATMEDVAHIIAGLNLQNPSTPVSTPASGGRGQNQVQIGPQQPSDPASVESGVDEGVESGVNANPAGVETGVNANPASVDGNSVGVVGDISVRTRN